jgi:hypothetical protein
MANQFEVIDHIDETPEPRTTEPQPQFKVGELVQYTRASIEEFKNNRPAEMMPWDFHTDKDINAYRIVWAYTFPSCRYRIQNLASGRIFENVAEQDLEKFNMYSDSYKAQIRDRKQIEQRFEENGWEYWLEQSKDNGLYLMKQCKTCKTLQPQVVRMLGGSDENH